MVAGRKLRQRELRVVGNIVVLVAVMAMVAVQWQFGMNAIDVCTQYNVKSNKKKKRCRVDSRLSYHEISASETCVHVVAGDGTRGRLHGQSIPRVHFEDAAAKV